MAQTRKIEYLYYLLIATLIIPRTAGPGEKMSFLSTRVQDGKLVINFRVSKLLETNRINAIGDELNALADASDAKEIVLDLKHVQAMSSAVLGQLIDFKKHCDAKNIALKLCNVSKEIQEIFKITNLNQVFKIYATREKAIRAF